MRHDEQGLILVFRCEEIPERLQNAFAALAGSGPAYIYQVDHALSNCVSHVRQSKVVRNYELLITISDFKC